MTRWLSSVLSLTVVLGSVPAQAQVAVGRTVLAPLSAPAPVPAGLVSPATGLSPALSPSALALSPASAPAVPNPVSVAPAIAAVRAPALAAESTPASAAPAKSAPLDALRVAAAPAVAADAGALFDGSALRSASAAVEPPQNPETAATPRRSLLQRYRDGRNKTPLQNAFGKALFVTSMAAVTVPALWGAAPAMKVGYALAVTDALILAVVLPIAAFAAIRRRLNRSPQTAAKPPPGRRSKVAVAVAGVLLGLGLSVTPYMATGPAVEHVQMFIDRNKAEGEQKQVAWIRGGAAEDETVKILSQNPVGREILDALRDRGGVLRLPTYYVSRQPTSYGQHESFTDGLYLDSDQIRMRGWTVEQFLADPELQRQLIREMSSTVLHELVHAVQGRRAPWTPGYFTNTIEAEQEAFFREMLFRLAELERDPAARNDGYDQWLVPDAADDLDAFLREIAELYPKNTLIGDNPYFNAYMAAQRERWPAFRVHIYQVLSARASTPASAKMYMEKAKAAAKEAGLEEPAPPSGSR